MFIEKELIKAVEDSYKKYAENKVSGSRSNKKLKPLHKKIVDILKEICGTEYVYYYQGDKDNDDKSSEKKVNGKYYDKRVDIAVVPKIDRAEVGKKKNGEPKFETLKDYNKRQNAQTPKFCLGTKFVMSNFSQNANNYFESMIGETVNIREEDIPYAHLLILRSYTPYYKKDGTEDFSKPHTLDDTDIQKYIKLCEDINKKHCPSVFYLLVVNIDEAKNEVKHIVNGGMFSKETNDVLNNQFSFGNLLSKLCEIVTSDG